MFAVQGNSHGVCCFHEKEETGPTQRQPERCSPQACVSWRSSNWDKLWQRELSAHKSILTWALFFFSFLLCFTHLRVKCQSLKVSHTLVHSCHFLSGIRKHTGSWVFGQSPPFSPCYLFCFFPCVTYFSSNGCWACHVWFEGKVVKSGCGVS